MFKSAQRAATGTGTVARSWWRAVIVPTLLALLAGHFVIVQGLTGVQFGDAPRNLHWGLLTWEQPGFLRGAVDSYERIKGFPPDPAELGPQRLWANGYGSLHPWWGPLTPGLFALVWGLTRSYLLLQLVIPLAAGATVLLTYGLGRLLLGPRAALVAASFLSLYPLFREYGTVAYNEALGTLVLSGALFAYLRGRTVPAVTFGTLAALTKMDLLALYAGAVIAGLLYDRFAGCRALSWRHHLLCLAGPLVLAAPWIWSHYLGAGARGPTRGFSGELFGIILPMLIELTFYIPWYGALLTLSVIGAVVVYGLRVGAVPRFSAVVLGAWLGLGLLVVLVYCATPGAGNSPRIFMPALPPLALLFAAGFVRLSLAWRRRIGFYLVALLLIVNAAVLWYQETAYAAPLRAAAPAFAELRRREPGFVLTPLYWETILYTRQPATWFEADDRFRDNIMGDATQFARYIAANPIHYVLLPNARRGPGPTDPADPGVRAYLDAHAERLDAGAWTLWALAKP